MGSKEFGAQNPIFAAQEQFIGDGKQLKKNKTK
jgi:hypothetical protein